MPVSNPPTVGVLVVNLGTPEAPTRSAVRRYLREFLWDPRVVEMFRPLWWLILHLVILQIRPRISAKAYRKVWTEQGSPLLVNSQTLGRLLQKELELVNHGWYKVATVMRYGRPCIKDGLESLRQAHVKRVFILPLYPQYASSTTGSVFDAVSDVVRDWRYIPNIEFINSYFDQPDYIGTIAEHIQKFWEINGKCERILFSFHGLPKKTCDRGDPYYEQCKTTSNLVAERMGLKAENWQLVFQSRFGREEWLTPYCIDVLKRLPNQGVSNIDIFCPGFSVDCLETLEEIALTNKQVFLAAGGSRYRYIPALNSEPLHIKALTNIILNNPRFLS